MVLNSAKVQLELTEGLSKTGKRYSFLEITVLDSPLGKAKLTKSLFLSELDAVLCKCVEL